MDWKAPERCYRAFCLHKELRPVPGIAGHPMGSLTRCSTPRTPARCPNGSQPNAQHTRNSNVDTCTGPRSTLYNLLIGRRVRRIVQLSCLYSSRSKQSNPKPQPSSTATISLSSTVALYQINDSCYLNVFLPFLKVQHAIKRYMHLVFI